MMRPELVDLLIILNLPHPNGMARELRNNPQQRTNSEYAFRFQQPDAHKALTAEGLAGWVSDEGARGHYVEAFERSSFEGMLNFYKIDAQGRMVRRVRHNVGNYAMCHDFAMSDKYAVFFLVPAVFKTPLKFLFGVHSIVDAMEFVEDMPTKVVVLSLEDLSIVREFECEPFFCYHFGNAYDEGDEVVVDVCRTERMGSMDAMRDHDIPHEKINVNGGACALGHPIGASGARILTTLLFEMRRRGLRRGLATLCVGVGQGVATLVERAE